MQPPIPLPSRLHDQLPLWPATEVSPPSDWCQRWNNRGHRWRHRSEAASTRPA